MSSSLVEEVYVLEARIKAANNQIRTSEDQIQFLQKEISAAIERNHRAEMELVAARGQLENAKQRKDAVEAAHMQQISSACLAMTQDSSQAEQQISRILAQKEDLERRTGELTRQLRGHEMVPRFN